MCSGAASCPFHQQPASHCLHGPHSLSSLSLLFSSVPQALSFPLITWLLIGLFYCYYFCLRFTDGISSPAALNQHFWKQQPSSDWLEPLLAEVSIWYSRGWGSQLQKQRRGPILCFKMVKMSEGREIYIKGGEKKGAEQRKWRGRREKGVSIKKRKKMTLHNRTKSIVNKM